MHPDLMRKIDLWLGAPLCFFLTLLVWLGRRLGRRRAPQGPPRRVLFIELAEIGGLVVAYPALAHARRRVPGAELYFLTFKGGQGILGLLGLFDPAHQLIIRSDSLGHFLRDTLAVIGQARRLKLDAVVNLETFARFSTILAFLTGAPRLVGFHRFHEEGHYLGDLITHKVIYNPHRHAAETFLTLVEALGEVPDREPRAKPPRTAATNHPQGATGTRGAGRHPGKLTGLYPDLAPGQRLVIHNAQTASTW